MLELARIFATRQFPGTLVFAAVDGEEEGLYGSSFMATQMAAAGNDVQGMFSNDIVGASQAFDGTKPDPHTLRLFLEGIPTDVTPAQISLMQSVGGENDRVSRQFGRFAADAAPFELTGMNIRLIWRRDRYLRGSDHVSFQGQGYPAARFTEPRENFDHEHRNVEVIGGVAGYEFVMRETTSPDWTSSTDVGNVTTVTLNISKDNVQFGVRAVDQDGNRSPVAFPLAVA
jgi:hypothetical protein